MISVLLSRVAGILMHPVETFRNSKEDQMGFVFSYLVLGSLLGAILAILVIMTVTGFPAFSGITTFSLISNTIIGPFMWIIVICLLSIWFYLFGHLAGGKKPLRSTFIVTAYSSTPAMLLGSIWGISPAFWFWSLTLVVMGLWSLVLLVIGMREIQELTTVRSIIAVAGAIIVLVLLAVILTLPAVMMHK
jgi:hypothetical protein